MYKGVCVCVSVCVGGVGSYLRDVHDHITCFNKK